MTGSGIGIGVVFFDSGSAFFASAEFLTALRSGIGRRRRSRDLLQSGGAFSASELLERTSTGSTSCPGRTS